MAQKTIMFQETLQNGAQASGNGVLMDVGGLSLVALQILGASTSGGSGNTVYFEGTLTDPVPFSTSDTVDDLGPGANTFTPVAMSGTTTGGTPWAIMEGSVLVIDEGAATETITVSVVTETTFTATTTKPHIGEHGGFPISGLVSNQAWIGVQSVNAATWAQDASATADGVWIVPVSGFSQIRARLAFHAGSVTVHANGTDSAGMALPPSSTTVTSISGVVGGPVANGGAPSGDPLDVAWDGTDTRRLFTSPLGELHTSDGGASTATVAAGSGNTVLKASSGRLCRVLVTAAGTGTGNVLFYDNATTNNGTVIGILPANAAIGTVYVFEMPAANGIVVANISNGPALTVSVL